MAFNSTRDGARNIYVMDVYTHHIQRLTDNGANNTNPTWSPDGREIAFASDYNNSYAIYALSVDCQDYFDRCAKRLTPNDPFWYAAPAWSPDGKHIAFMTTKDTVSIFNNSMNSFNIYVMNRDGSDSHRLTQNVGEDDSPAWSPDGRYIVYSAQNIQLGRMELTIADTQCQTHCIHLLFSDTIDLMPTWSNDGHSIAFVDARDGTFEMYVTDTQGRYLQRLTYNLSDESSPSWRP